MHRQLRRHPVFRRLVVLDQDLAQTVFSRAGKLLLAWVTAHTDRVGVFFSISKSVSRGPAGELFVQAIAKSWHDPEPFGEPLLAT